MYVSDIYWVEADAADKSRLIGRIERLSCCVSDLTTCAAE